MTKEQQMQRFYIIRISSFLRHSTPVRLGPFVIVILTTISASGTSRTLQLRLQPREVCGALALRE